MKKQLLFLSLCLLSFMNGRSQSFTCGDTLVDTRDGKKYLTVLIGSQCWMKQNLNYGKTVSSYSSTSTHSDMFNNSIAEKYAPNGDSTKLPQYGGLYEWDEVMNYSTVAGSKGLCPANWHVPTDAEWQSMITAAGGTMITTTGGSGGNKLKAVGEGFGAGAGTNTSGFSAKAAGDRDSYGIFYGLGLRFIFWTSTQTTSPSAYQYTLWAEKDTIARDGNIQKITGLSCRCVRDAGAGIEDHSLNNGIKVFPNPAGAIFTIETKQEGKAEFSIYDLLGNKIMEASFSSSLTIETKDWPRGLYFYKITTNSGKGTGKLVVQ
jgi:uncharacterized protein (TIGR02145 family)